MADRQTTTFPVRGLDLATSGHGTQPGDMRLLSGMVPVGYSDRLEWEVPNRATVPTDGNDNPTQGLLSLGQHTDQRLVGLRSDEVVVIDPANAYAETQVYSFSSTDATRRATFATVQDSTMVAVTKGTGIGDPEVLVEVTGTRSRILQWLPLPRLRVSTTGVGLADRDDALQGGRYAFRIAWEMADGTLGPASYPYRVAIEDTAFANVEVNVLTYPQAYVGTVWEDKIENIVLIGHVDGQKDPESQPPRTTVQPEENTGHIIERKPLSRVGQGSFIWSGTREDILTGETWDQTGLDAHERVAGTVSSYNQRVLLGDLEYDLFVPDIRSILDFDFSSDSGTDYHLLLQVEVETAFGTVTRRSEALGVTASFAQNVSTRSGNIWYPDPRATRYQFFISADYTPPDDLSTGTWQVPAMIGASKRFDEPLGGAFAYEPVTAGEPYDMTVTGNVAGVNLTKDRRFYRPLRSADFWVDLEPWELPGTSQADDPEPTEGYFDWMRKQIADGEEYDNDQAETITVPIADITGTPDADTVDQLVVDYDVEAEITGNPDNNITLIGAELDVTLLDEENNTLATAHREAYASGVNVITNAGSFTAAQDGSGDTSGWTAGDVAYVQYEVFFNMGLLASGGDLTGKVKVEVDSSSLDINHSEPSENPDFSMKGNDVNQSRVVWSETNRPWALDAENVVYAGSQSEDRVLALQAVGQEVSEGQYGQFPIVCLGRESVRVLQTGTDPFIQSVELIEADAGAVGRRAYTNMEGVVVAALDTGVYQFTPQQQTPALSSPIHDDDGDVLGELGPDTALSSFLDQARGRRSVWMHLPNVTLGYNTRFGSWFALDRKRLDTAFVRDQYYAVRDDNTLVREEQDNTTAAPVRLQTAVIQPGPQGHLGRAYEVQLRQPFDLDEVTLSLVATDPTNDYVKLGEAVLQAGQYNAGLHLGAGLAPGFVVDVQGDGSPGQMVEAIMLEWEPRHETLRDHQGHGTPGYSGGSASPILVLTDVSSP
jgi:hypothetical protein